MMAISDIGPNSNLMISKYNDIKEPQDDYVHKSNTQEAAQK